jgi:hypothetical protein
VGGLARYYLSQQEQSVFKVALRRSVKVLPDTP